METKEKPRTKTTTSKKSSKKKFPWRKGKGSWTNTLLEKKLLQNPSLMTNEELADALAEHNKWRRGEGKYHWEQDPLAEGAETEPPFSCDVLGRFVDETCARLWMMHAITLGRFK